jgi:hypothetical protein
LLVPLSEAAERHFMSDSFPVVVEARLSNGQSELVRVGTATKTAEGFSLSLFPLSIQLDGVNARNQPSAAPQYSSQSGGEPSVFPPYGRSKGQPIRGASSTDLEFYLSGSKRSLADPSKERFHGKERLMVAAIEAEINRQRGGGGDFGGNAPDDIPPPNDDDAPF